MKIYLASSWRNTQQPVILNLLKENGFEVYDFRDPLYGFRWSSIDPNWLNWTPTQFMKNCKHSKALKGFNKDFDAMLQSDCCVLLLPCGRSAHLEAGWFIGAGKPVHILLSTEKFEPELMYNLATGIHSTTEKLIFSLKNLDQEFKTPNRDMVVIYDPDIHGLLWCTKCEEQFEKGEEIITFDWQWFDHYECYLEAIHEEQTTEYDDVF
jgi:nucleoside 2-deoxyribosyltransferase